MYTHTHLVQGDKIAQSKIAFGIIRTAHKDRFLHKSLGHGLHLFCGILIAAQNHGTGIAATLLIRKHHCMNDISHQKQPLMPI
ncbi:hypothetical protein SDC9_179848 [bioreactor metagenome]|uniref:Uncharacterized protein n=1 Tax=bioreactor metagenome TaxID=1076179 RepID=A0A645H0Z9_9ZZZZ